MDVAADPFPLQDFEAGMQGAEEALRANRLEHALQAYCGLLQRVLARRLDTGLDFRAADMVAMERVAELAALMARLDAADSLLATMVQLGVDAGHALLADHAQLKRAEMFADHGRLTDAFARLDALRPRIGAMHAMVLDEDGLLAWERGLAWHAYPPDECAALLTRCLAVMGRMLLGLGRYDEALAVIERGLVHAEQPQAPDLARRAHGKLSWLRARALAERGDLDAAVAAVALHAHQPATALAIGARMQWLDLQGRLAMWQGRLGDAVQHLRQGMAVGEEVGLAHARLASALNLAHVLVLLNRVEEALALIEEARATARDLRDEPLRARCAALRQLAIARRSSDAHAMAMAWSVREMVEGRVARPDGARPRPAAIEGTVASEDFLARFEERALQFQWALAASAEEAQPLLEAMRVSFGATDSHLVAARLSMLEGLLHVRRGDHASAAPALHKAALNCAALGLKAEQWQASQLRARSLLRLGRHEDAATTAAQADELLASLGDTMEAGDRALYLLNKATPQEEMILSLVDALQREAAAPGLSRWRAHLGMLRRLHRLLETLDRHRAGLTARYAPGRADEPARATGAHHIGLWRRLLNVPRHQATLVFVVLPDRLLLIWSTWLRMGFAVSPVTRIALREEVRRWHEHACGALRPDHSSPEGTEILARLAQLLQLDAVLESLPTKISRLVCVADDVLHGLPFAALPYRGRYLIEQFALSMAFDSHVARLSEPRLKRGLVVGVRASAGGETLKAVEGECQTVAEWFADHGMAGQLLSERAATCEKVLTSLSGADMAYLACHGASEPDQPDRSGLRLAPTESDDGVLSIRRLAGLRWQACRHVTLSACWSADGFVLPGRWVISLPEVLWRSGVRSVLGSLWPVVDEVAAPFMQRFHTALARMPLDDALRAAQLACLAGELRPDGLDGRSVASPYFWAGFVLHGQMGRLKLPR